MHSGTNMEACNRTKIEAHSAPKKEAHSAPKMEAQSWRLNLFFASLDNLVKSMQTWATEKWNISSRI